MFTSLLTRARALLRRHPPAGPEPMPPGGHVKILPDHGEPDSEEIVQEPPDTPAAEAAVGRPTGESGAPGSYSAAQLLAAGLSQLQVHQAFYAPELLPPDILTAIKEGRYGR
jgi:hypothetical protein